MYETHLHTSEASACGQLSAAEQVRLFKEAGYTGVVITDHFVGGIGTNSAPLRRKVCESLGYLGLELNETRNMERGDGKISADGSKVTVWRLKTDEESVVASCVREFLQN